MSGHIPELNVILDQCCPVWAETPAVGGWHDSHGGPHFNSAGVAPNSARSGLKYRADVCRKRKANKVHILDKDTNPSYSRV